MMSLARIELAPTPWKGAMIPFHYRDVFVLYYIYIHYCLFNSHVDTLG